jgi:hypothetical protein
MSITGREQFVVVPALRGGFPALGGALARKLAEVGARPNGHCFILWSPLGEAEGQAFVQGMTGEDLVYLEAANLGAWDTGAPPLTDEQRDRLQALGWEPPESPTEANYFRSEQPDWVAISALLISTLATVYGTTEEDAVGLDVFAADGDPDIDDAAVAVPLRRSEHRGAAGRRGHRRKRSGPRPGRSRDHRQ